MADGKFQAVANMTTRQKATIGLFIVVLLIVIWQVAGLFGSNDSSAPPPQRAANMPAVTAPGAAAPAVPATLQRPQAAQLIKQQAPLSQRELELMKLQQETQAKYLAALNELQLLKVSKDIAETNQAIAKAKLETISAEKNIVNMLAPPPPPVTPAAYASGLVNPASAAAPEQTPPSPPANAVTQQETNYTVVSVSLLQYRWSAVLGYQGSLYNVSVGDVLPPDRSKVVSIDKTGVWIEKDNTKRKLSLVPII